MLTGHPLMPSSIPCSTPALTTASIQYAVTDSAFLNEVSVSCQPGEDQRFTIKPEHFLARHVERRVVGGLGLTRMD